MIYTIFAPRKRAYRQLVATIGYHLARDTRHSSLAIGPIMNLEKNEMQSARKQKKEGE